MLLLSFLKSYLLTYIWIYYCCFSSGGIWNVVVYGQTCVYTSNGYKLNLAQISGISYQWADISSGFSYYWTPCTNAVPCGSFEFMAAQVKSGVSGVCTNLAAWDSSVRAVYDGSTWTLQYNTGSDCDGDPTNTQFFLTCTTSTSINRITQVSNPNGGCEYDFYATGPAFCATASDGDDGNGGSDSGSDSDGLSGGWVFIIILLVVTVLYCGIGYAYNKTKHPDSSWTDFKTNIPHLNFWCNIPKWTWAGCCVTKEWISSKFGDNNHTLIKET